ncbi:MAG: hydrogenase maturation nickel metallochaperone HypA [Desulfatiglans sp.]|jgi:hydrogenase nickel incorporation protein HypA/HybF|nr:hydrogenase maturation nickel metallochaperone HypA [Thermodesulfobacteriota bacterium]MEE4353438.1 hydrogenase maturation nickel metallochaperone HypA [Desulfatiglans sp.]
MHEFGLAQSIVTKILKIAEANRATKIVGLNLEVGEVSLVNPEQLKWHMEILTADTMAQDMEVTILEVPVRIRCPTCGYEGGVHYQKHGNEQLHSRIPDFDCVECGRTDTIIIQGKELSIKDINVSFE